jgi:hypothetical protein
VAKIERDIYGTRKIHSGCTKEVGMMDCKSISTPMVTNLRKLHDSDTGSDLVDPTMYRQLIGSLMYMIHTRPDICYVVIVMSQFMTESR